MSKERLYLFDTTLRDGAQTMGVDFSVEDKRQVALALDVLGLDYIEGGWPGANPTDNAYALACITAAHEAGAQWIVLCDTNGGVMPEEAFDIVSAVKAKLPNARLGIHAHNDTEQAVAVSLAAVRAGVRQVQGTLNGL